MRPSPTSSLPPTSYPAEPRYFSQLLIDFIRRWQIPRMCSHLVLWENRLKSEISRTVSGPLMASTEWTHPLGKLIRVRIDRECTSLRLYTGCSLLSSVEGCQLPPLENRSADADSRPICEVDFRHITRNGPSYVRSKLRRERSGSLQNTVRWNETMYM